MLKSSFWSQVLVDGDDAVIYLNMRMPLLDTFFVVVDFLVVANFFI